MVEKLAPSSSPAGSSQDPTLVPRLHRPLGAVCGYALVAGLAVLLGVQWSVAVRAGNAAAAKGMPTGNAAVAKGTPAASDDPCAAMTPVVLNKPAPGFTLPSLTSGKPQTLAALRGKPVLLHFWFTECPPCVEELPSLTQLHRQLKKDGDKIRLITVSVDEDAKKARAFIDKHGLTDLRVLHDPERKTSAAYGTEKFPETYLIGADGTIALHFINKRDWTAPAARACLKSAVSKPTNKQDKKKQDKRQPNKPNKPTAYPSE